MEGQMIPDGDESVPQRALTEQPSKEDLKQEVMKSKMTLRKQKLNTIISSKRRLHSFLNYEEEAKYSINVGQLQVSLSDLIDCDKFFSNFNVNLLAPYLQSKDENYIKYSVHLIKTYIAQKEECHLNKLVSQLTNSDYIFEILLSFLCREDSVLSFNASFILINVAYTDEGEKLFAKSSKFIEALLTYMSNSKYDKANFLNALLLLKNATYHTQTMKIILIRSKLFELLKQAYELFCLYGDVMNQIINTITSYSTLITHDNLDNFLSTIDMLQSKLYLKYENIQGVLFVLLNMLKFKSAKIIKLYFAKKIDKYLISIYPSEKVTPAEYNISQRNLSQIRYMILDILTRLISLDGDDLSIQFLINNGVFPLLNDVLQSTDPKIINHVCDLVHNIAVGSVGQISGLYQHNVMDSLIKTSFLLYDVITAGHKCEPDYKTSVYAAFGGTANAIAVVFIGSLSDTLVDKLKYGDYAAVKVLVGALKIFKDDKDVCGDILSVIYKIFCIPFDEPRDTDFIDVMIKDGLEDVLRDLALSSNSDIATSAEQILNDMIEMEVDKEEDTNYREYLEEEK